MLSHLKPKWQVADASQNLGRMPVVLPGECRSQPSCGFWLHVNVLSSFVMLKALRVCHTWRGLLPIQALSLHDRSVLVLQSSSETCRLVLEQELRKCFRWDFLFIGSISVETANGNLVCEVLWADSRFLAKKLRNCTVLLATVCTCEP